MAFLIFGYDLTQTILHIPAQAETYPPIGIEGDTGEVEKDAPERVGHGSEPIEKESK